MPKDKEPIEIHPLIEIRPRQREAYNLARVFSGKESKRWNLLFERKI